MLTPQAFDLLRPTESDRASDAESIRADVDARLWEDPFAAVRRADLARIKTCDEASRFDPAVQSKCAISDRDREDLLPLRSLVAKPDQTLVIAALVSGNPFVGAEEQRRRLRYALLKGLSSARYVPHDAAHIGRALARLPATEFRPDADVARQGASITLPYETLDLPCDPNADRAGCPRGERQDGAAVVLWIDEASLGRRKLDAFALLMAKILPDDAGRIRLKVLGPSSSGTLRDALADLRNAASHIGALSPGVLKGYRMLARADFFNVFATAPARYLLPEGSESREAETRSTADRIQDFIQRESEPFLTGCRAGDGGAPCTPTFATTIGDDGLAAEQIAGELCARGLAAAGAREPTGGESAGAESACADPKSRPKLGPGHRVVLIGEWDSLYSQTLLKLFDDKLCAQGQRCIESYTYLAGLDGVTLPSGREAGRADGAGVDAGSAASASGPGAKPSPVEWPESRDQRDYIRALARELADSEANSAGGWLRRIDAIGGGPIQGMPPGRIEAIGLIGSDVHDKLLLLEALRAQFPDRNIFTTDLDSRYLHPRALPFTRNLLVASTYALEAAPGVPMRDAYQAAVFKAAQLAAGESELSAAVRASVAVPAVYVIGRTAAHCLLFPRGGSERCGAVALPRRAAAHVSAYVLFMGLVLLGVLVWPGTPSLRRLVNGLPVGEDDGARSGRQYGAERGFGFIFFAVLNGAALVWFCGSGIEMADPGTIDTGVLLHAVAISSLLLAALGLYVEWWDRRSANRRQAQQADPPWWRPFLRLAAVAAILLGPILSLALVRHPDLHRILEPAFVIEGVSGWPSQLLRCVALILAAGALDRAWFDDGEAIHALERCLGMASAQNASKSGGRDRAGARRDAGFLETILVQSWIFSWTYDAKRRGTFMTLWNDYREYGRSWAHASRIVIGVVMFVLGAMVIQFWLDAQQVPGLPVRGEEHRTLMLATQMAAALALIVCLVMVIDATLLAATFIWHLNRSRTIYPSEVLRRFARSLGHTDGDSRWIQAIRSDPANRGTGEPRHSLLDNWIDVQVVAKRTERTGSLLIAPFVVLALLLVARSSIFDNWAVTRGLAALMSGYALLLIAAAVRVKTLAEQTRRTALDSMSADLRWLAGAGENWSGLKEQFQRMIEAVRKNRTGAFAPLFNQPLVHAILLPLGGIGGSQLLDYFLLTR